MKEQLTSFLSSTRSNTNGEKSITTGRTHKISKDFISLVVLVCAFFLASTNISIAQSNEPGAASVSTVIADPVLSQWKSSVEYASVITSMKVSTTKILTDPNLQPPEFALYTGFDRMLSYIQADLEAQAEITKIAEKNYNKVVLEAPSDPILINMQMAEFAALYDALVNKLHQ